MNNYLQQEYYFKLKVIGVYQIIGGLVGMGLMIWVITMSLPMPFVIVCIFVVSIALFLFSIACGIGLLFKKWTAINLSLILQLMQIISFTFHPLLVFRKMKEPLLVLSEGKVRRPHQQNEFPPCWSSRKIKAPFVGC